MYGSRFEVRIKDLAQRSGLRIAEMSPAFATFRFNVPPKRGNILTIKAGLDRDIWMFASPSSLTIRNESDQRLFSTFLVSMLKLNTDMIRGHWCLFPIYPSSVGTLTCIHKICDSLLTPDEFKKICDALVESVGAVNEALA